MREQIRTTDNRLGWRDRQCQWQRRHDLTEGGWPAHMIPEHPRLTVQRDRWPRFRRRLFR